MTETNKDGKKADEHKNGEKGQNPANIISLGQDREKTGSSDPGDKGNAEKKENPTIGVDEKNTFIEIRIPMRLDFWTTMGFIHEILIPHIRAIKIEKARQSALKNKLIRPNQKGWRGFNPFGK